MRLLMIATPEGPFIAAAKAAQSKGASVIYAHSGELAVGLLQSGCEINIVMVEIGVDIGDLAERLRTDGRAIPIIACGTRNDVRVAIAAMRAGATEYISLQPDADIIAVMLGAVADGTGDPIESDDAVALVVAVAEQVRPSGGSVRRTLAEVECELVLDTLKECLGNRTHAAEMLGISVRTLRNKINDYASYGLPVSPPMAHAVQARLKRFFRRKWSNPRVRARSASSLRRSERRLQRIAR
jgi:DNA-binding NtrC family response regulator